MIVTDLIFNMGPTTFSKFVNTLKFINAQDWANASSNLQQSAWFHQVGRRGRGDVAVLSGASTPQDILGA